MTLHYKLIQPSDPLEKAVSPCTLLFYPGTYLDTPWYINPRTFKDYLLCVGAGCESSATHLPAITGVL